MRCNPTSASALWLFLLSCMARRNGLLSLRLPQRKIVTPCRQALRIQPPPVQVSRFEQRKPE